MGIREEEIIRKWAGWVKRSVTHLSHAIIRKKEKQMSTHTHISDVKLLSKKDTKQKTPKRGESKSDFLFLFFIQIPQTKQKNFY